MLLNTEDDTVHCRNFRSRSPTALDTFYDSKRVEAGWTDAWRSNPAAYGQGVRPHIASRCTAEDPVCSLLGVLLDGNRSSGWTDRNCNDYTSQSYS